MVAKKSRILVVDDDRSLTEIVVNILEYEGYSSDVANDGRTALAKIEQNPCDLLLLDLKLTDMSGMDILEKVAKKKNPPQVIVISGEGTIHTAIRATRLGAYDFIEKPLDSERLLVSIKNALQKSRLENEKARLLENVKEQYKMIGESDPVVEMQKLITKATHSDSKVLITGENGTGKELAARAIHINSARATGPFIAVNCAAVPDTLIESELFGYKKGAFTGAIQDKPGRFQLADGGTLFLDEIGDMSLITQAKVLRVLEEGAVEMIGGNQLIPLDIRVIASTNKDLQKQMETGNFREDLYFRLNVLCIHIPPLRERKSDIPLLIDFYIREFCRENGVKTKEVSPEAMTLIMDYSWPGNIRELRNFVEKAIVLVESLRIEFCDVQRMLEGEAKRKVGIDIPEMELKDARQLFEREYIKKILKRNQGNITRTSEKLGIPRTYLYRKMKNLNIPLQE